MGIQLVWLLLATVVLCGMASVKDPEYAYIWRAWELVGDSMSEIGEEFKIKDEEGIGVMFPDGIRCTLSEATRGYNRVKTFSCEGAEVKRRRTVRVEDYGKQFEGNVAGCHWRDIGSTALPQWMFDVYPKGGGSKVGTVTVSCQMVRKG